LAPILERQYTSYRRELEALLLKDSPIISLRMVGNQSLTTLGITANYFAQPHVDEEDMGFAFLTWFIKGKYLFIFNYFQVTLICILWCINFIYICVIILIFIEREGVGHMKTSGEFLFSTFGLFILPRNGTTLAFSSSTVDHCTRIAYG